jgi:hypothetical protein
MKIKYTEFALNPQLRGTTTHLPAHRAQALIDSGAAVEVKMPPHGTPGWLEARAEQEQVRIDSLPADRRETFPTVVTWQVYKLPFSGKLGVVRLYLTEKTIYEPALIYDRGRPDFKASQKNFVSVLKIDKCPESVIQQYLDAVNAPNYLAMERARIAEDQRNAAAQQERERNAPRFI